MGVLNIRALLGGWSVLGTAMLRNNKYGDMMGMCIYIYIYMGLHTHIYIYIYMYT